MGATMKVFEVTNKTQREIPVEIVQALAKAQHRLQYTRLRDVFFVVWTWGEIVGVCGDGDNGAYEWFRLKADKNFETSNCGYGNPHSPLREVLNLAHETEES